MKKYLFAAALLLSLIVFPKKNFASLPASIPDLPSLSLKRDSYIVYSYHYYEWYKYTDKEKNVEFFLETLFADYLKHDESCKKMKGETSFNKREKKVIIKISCTER